MTLIRITRRVPVADEHGIRVNNVYEAEDATKARTRVNRAGDVVRARSEYLGSWWVVSESTGERVRILAHECEVVPFHWRYCTVLKYGCSGIYHKCNEKGLPACGTRVDTCAIEHMDDARSYDPCKRCFR